MTTKSTTISKDKELKILTNFKGKTYKNWEDFKKAYKLYSK